MALFVHSFGAMTHHGTNKMVGPSDLDWIQCNSVLCWVHSTAEVDPVVGVARALAAERNGSCQVWMCLDTQHLINSGEGHRPSPLTPEKIEQAEKALAKLYGSEMQTMVVPGKAITELRRFVSNHPVDLIVMGERGLAFEKECGERLCDDIPCPLMILLPPTAQSNIAPACRE